MKVAGEILIRVAALLAVSVACYLIGFSEYPSLGGVALNIVIGISVLAASRGEVFAPLPSRHLFAGVFLGVAFVAFALWGASSGYTQASNEWFKNSVIRPWLAGIFWLAYACALMFSYRQHLVGGKSAAKRA